MKCDTVTIVLALCIAGVAYSSYRQNQALLRDLRHARAETDSLDAAVRAAQAETDSARRADSAQVIQGPRRTSGLQRNLTAAQAATDSLLEIVVHAAPDDSLSGIVADLRTQIENERLVARTLIDTLISQRDWAYSRMAYWREVVAGRDGQLAVAQRLLREAIQAKRPRMACGLTVNAGIGVRGADIVAGYGCTIRIP